ncbi:MAG TPA: 6-phosphogluconolactonase [Chlorobaculum parvum]|uniref:6-phosphogluconolactonase n=1 Tax=Chlorobaculum parvum TaxID=274539 RepID=A0A7C5DE76_9CHLB|nr:6-phosphogluconolactonase [Chlorobaculum parvum]
MTNWISAPHDELLEKAVAFITDLAYRAVAERGRFTLVLSGGKTPAALYLKLARGIKEGRYLELGYTLPDEARRPVRDPESIILPWPQTLLFQGDERYLPLSHPDSNYGMARKTLIRYICIKPANIHRMSTESGDPEADARRYEALLRGLFRKRGNSEAPPSFDLILLGLGDDGHTASLMPDDKAALAEKERWVIAVDAPNGKPPGTRLTLTLPAINEAKTVLFLVPPSRYEFARSISNGEKPELPSGMVKPRSGDVWWFVEKE